MPTKKVPCPSCGRPKGAKARFCRSCSPPYERSPEQRRHLSEHFKGRDVPWRQGVPHSLETRAKIAAAWTDERREAARQRGLLMAENREWLLVIGEALAGQANPNFQGKGQGSDYGVGFGRGYKERIKARAAGVCELCGATGKRLDLHHRDFGKTDHSPDNLLVICRSCHKKEHFANAKRHLSR